MYIYTKVFVNMTPAISLAKNLNRVIYWVPEITLTKNFIKEY